VALAADAPLAVDDAVFGPGGEVGRLTSAAEHAGRWVALGRVRWDAHHGPFRTASGVLLEPSDTPAQTT
jgi:hypothetical protein